MPKPVRQLALCSPLPGTLPVARIIAWEDGAGYSPNPVHCTIQYRTQYHVPQGGLDGKFHPASFLVGKRMLGTGRGVWYSISPASVDGPRGAERQGRERGEERRVAPWCNILEGEEGKGKGKGRATKNEEIRNVEGEKSAAGQRLTKLYFPERKGRIRRSVISCRTGYGEERVHTLYWSSTHEGHTNALLYAVITRPVPTLL